MKKSIAVSILGFSVLNIAAAHGADYPLQKRTAIVFQQARVEPAPVCFRSRFAYVRYAPVLATAYATRPVLVEEPTPCVRPLFSVR